jgi:hypothetical protein
VTSPHTKPSPISANHYTDLCSLFNLSTHIYLNLQSCNMDGGLGQGTAPARGRVLSYITVAMYCNINARGFETLTDHYLYICAGI